MLIQVGIIVSLAITVLIGWVTGKRVKGKVENYYVAGRRLSFLMVGVALVAQSIDGNATLGNSSLGFDFGFWAGAALPIGLALSLFLLGLFFAPKLNSLKLLTLADFFSRKYNRTIEVLASLLMLLSFGVLLAGNLAAVAILLNLFFNINYQTSVVLICLAALIYSIRGGILSDILSDYFQVALLVIGGLSTFGYLFFKYDLAQFFNSEIFSSGLSLTQLTQNADGALINWATIFALGFGNLLAIDFVARTLAAKSAGTARKACFLGGVLTLLLGIPFSILPLLLQWLNFVPAGEAPVLMAFALETMPAVVTLLLTCGIIGVSLSTIDGAMLSMGNVLAHNLLNIKKDLRWGENNSVESEKSHLYFSRLALVPVAGSAVIFAMLLPSPGALIAVAFDIMFAGLLVPFVFAFIFKKVYAKAALYAIIAGGLARLLFVALTPTSFGIDNGFFYVENSIISPTLDGLGTFLAPLVALYVYLMVHCIMVLKNNKQESAALVNNQPHSEPVRASSQDYTNKQ
ncbi:MAG: sodium:solute symporter [Parcubacteria group bacterium]|nr:sodium:solute symporter [Parcubacteria group bacterium]